MRRPGYPILFYGFISLHRLKKGSHLEYLFCRTSLTAINPDHLALDLKYYPISLRSMSSRLIVLRISVCMMCQNLWSFQVLSWYIQQQMTLPITDNVHVHLAGHGNAVAFLERSLAFILLWRHFKPIEYVMNVPDPPEWPCCEPYVRTLLSCTCGNYTTYSN